MKLIKDLRLLAEQHEDWDTEMVKYVTFILFTVGTFDHVLISDDLFEKSVGLMEHHKKESQ